MPRNRGTHLVELARVFAGTPISSAWALKAWETRRARSAQIVLPLQLPQDAREVAAPHDQAGREVAQLPRPIARCRFIGSDGCCAHPSAVTAECHRYAPCPRLMIAASAADGVPYAQ
jgi:hypothetical protein